MKACATDCITADNGPLAMERHRCLARHDNGAIEFSIHEVYERLS